MGVILIVILYPPHIISVSQIFSFLFYTGGAISIVLLPLVLRKDKNGKTLLSEIGVPFFILFNFLGGGALFTSLILLFNYTGRSTATYTEIYKLGEKDSRYKVGSYTGIVYHLIDNPRPDEVDLRWFDLKDNYTVFKRQYIQLEFSKGLFGIEVFEKRSAVSDSSGSDYIEVPLIGDGY